MISMANTGVSIRFVCCVSKRSVRFQTCCSSFSAESDITMIVHIAIASISFAKSEISATEIKTIFRKTLA